MGPCQCEGTVDNNPALQNRGGICGQYCHMSLQVNMVQGNGGRIFAVSSFIELGA